MLGVQLNANAYLARLKQEIDHIDSAQLDRLADLLYEAWEKGRFVFVLGNGGSAATASHLAEDLGKNCLTEEKLHDEGARRLKILSLTDNTPWVTALGNDCGYDEIFVQQLMHYGSAGDLVVAISGSGNSSNILKAVDWANRHGLTTYGITGFDGGKLKAMQQAGLHVALDDMGMVESVHLCAGHWVVDELHARVNGVGRYSAGQ